MNILKRIQGDSIIKPVLMLVSGSAMGAMINFLSQPIISRLYKPEDIGGYALIFSVVTLLSSIVNMQYDLTIVSAKTEEEANALAVASFWTGLLVITVTGIALVFIQFYNPSIFKGVGWWILSSCIMLLVFSISQILTSYNNRNKQYKLLSKVTVTKDLFRSIFQIALSIFHIGFIGVLIGNLMGFILGAYQQIGYVKENFQNIISVKRSDVIRVVKKYYQQPLFSAPALLCVTASNSLMTFFINYLYGTHELGLYAFAMNMVGIPATLISSNMGKVFFKKASDEYVQTGGFKHALVKTTAVLFVLTIPIFTFIYFFAELLFSKIFGEAWTRAGYIVSLLTPMQGVRFVVTAVMFGFIIGGKQLPKLLMQMMFIVETIVSVYIAKAMQLPIVAFIRLTNYLFIVNYVVMYVFIYYTSGKKKNMQITKEE